MAVAVRVCKVQSMATYLRKSSYQVVSVYLVAPTSGRLCRTMLHLTRQALIWHCFTTRVYKFCSGLPTALT